MFSTLKLYEHDVNVRVQTRVTVTSQITIYIANTIVPSKSLRSEL